MKLKFDVTSDFSYKHHFIKCHFDSPVTNTNAFAFKDKPVLLNPHVSPYLGAKWWKWVLEIPTPINPLIDANPCNVNQHGLFFFLAGVFNR